MTKIITNIVEINFHKNQKLYDQYTSQIDLIEKQILDLEIQKSLKQKKLLQLKCLIRDIEKEVVESLNASFS